MNSLIYQIGVKVLEIYLNIACFTGNQKAKKAKIGRRNWKNHLELFKKRKNLLDSCSIPWRSNNGFTNY